MKQDIEYEKLTQEIYQSILQEEGHTIEVRHDVKIKGKASEHQIDVYWEYTIAGVNHRVAIECKNHNNNISIGRVRDFYGALSDIGNINGIMVTKIGYQKGAKKFADMYGINLVLLREPTDEDWKGRIKTAHTTFKSISINATNYFVLLDQDWFKDNLTQSEIDAFSLKLSGRNDELWILDENGNKLKNFLQLQDEAPCGDESQLQLQHFYPFDDGYIIANNRAVKIKGVRITYDVSVGTSKTIFDLASMVRAVVKDVRTGKMKFIKTNL